LLIAARVAIRSGCLSWWYSFVFLQAIRQGRVILICVAPALLPVLVYSGRTPLHRQECLCHTSFVISASTCHAGAWLTMTIATLFL
jgi:hypothetical protein